MTEGTVQAESVPAQLDLEVGGPAEFAGAGGVDDQRDLTVVREGDGGRLGPVEPPLADPGVGAGKVAQRCDERWEPSKPDAPYDDARQPEREQDLERQRAREARAAEGRDAAAGERLPRAQDVPQALETPGTRRLRDGDRIGHGRVRRHKQEGQRRSLGPAAGQR